MEKRYGWIYVLPLLLAVSIFSFGALGLRSAIGEQRMQQELAKLEWKMEPVLAGEYTQPFFEEEVGVIKLYDQGEDGMRRLHWFSSDGRELSEEEVDELYELYDERIYADTEEELATYKKQTAIGHESMRELFGEDLLIWTDFCDGLALLYYKDKLVCADENGNIVFEKKARIPKRYIEGGSSETNSIITGLNRQGFCDGLAVFTLDGCKYGVVDSQGNIVIEPVFKGKNTLMVLNDHHIRVFYERVFRIGKLEEWSGGEDLA
jgi:hypothetical protein